MQRLPLEYAVRNLGRSPIRLVLSICGSALVVLLVLASAAFVVGMKQSLHVSGSPHNVIVLGSGSEESVERSEIGARVPTILTASVPGIKSRLGVSYVSPEIHMALSVKARMDEDQGSLAVVRGVTPQAFLVHSQVQMLEGRMPEAGRDEIMIGRLVASKLGRPDEALSVGSQLWIDDRPWTISGRFEAPQTVMDAEIWCPLTDLLVVAKRETISCVIVTLDDTDTSTVADIQTFAAQRLDLEITAMTEQEYYRQLAAFFGPIRVLVLVTATLIAIGGILGGLNTMYAAFAARVREFGTLQVLGYRRTAIVWSLVQESTLTAAVGALIAVLLGVLVLDGVAIRFSMGAFGLIVDHTVVSIAILAGLALGVVGSLPPAWRCLHMPVTESLKSA